MRRAAAVALMSIAVSIGTAVAQDTNHDGVVSVLVPFNSPEPVPGLNGTLWQTQLWVHTTLAQGVRLRDCGSLIGPPCENPLHLPGITELAFPQETIEARPFVITLPTAIASTVELSSRLFELSRQSERTGTYLPLVREEKFLARPARLIAIPNHSAARIALRVYDPRFRRGSSVDVEILGADDELLGQFTLMFEYHTGGLPGYSAGAVSIYDLAAAVTRLAGVSRFDIRVTPSPGTEFWAAVSVTDNATQQVLLITPGNN